MSSPFLPNPGIMQLPRSLENTLKLSILVSAILASLTSFSLAGPPDFPDNANDVVVTGMSDDMESVLVTSGYNKGLSLLTPQTGAIQTISSGTNAGYGATITPDNKYVAYKSFAKGTQLAMLHDIAAGKAIELASGELVGTPAGSASGTIAYTVGNTLLICDASLNVTGKHDLGHHVNTLSVSPDGRRIAYNDANHQIVILDARTGRSRIITDGKTPYWGPKFSPSGRSILASAVNGDVYVGRSSVGKLRKIGTGLSPSWLSESSLLFTEKATENGKVSRTTIKITTTSGRQRGSIEREGDASVVSSLSNLAVSSGKNVEYGYLQANDARLVPLPIRNDLSNHSLASAEPNSSAPPVAQVVVDTGSTVRLNGVPYISQIYDTADNWNGDWSCNAAAAIMAIQYHNILPKHPMTASWPYPHTSDYGWYINNIYSFNGHTYNVGSWDPDGLSLGYGAYGWITQQNWLDTKGRMAQYISWHGPTSGVDWSPTVSEGRGEINANHPFVMLTSLTPPGHYPLCIGYFKNQYTFIFNDPYGNKNLGYPNYSGIGASYDWPGYNNGYQNMVTVHCYIYCRFGQPSAPSGVTATAVSSSQINLSWNDNSYCEANNEVWRSTISGGPYSLVASLGANVKSYSNGGLAGGTTYYYVIRASNASGSSGNSNQASATTQGGGATEVIIDNAAAQFTASSNWATGTSAADKYGSNYRYRPTGAISDSAVWNFNVTQARNYEVYAWWSAGTNRSATAPYIMPDNTNAPRNQQTNGGKWNSLGIKNLSTGAKTVKLSCWTTSGYIVLADAIRITPR